MTLSAMTSIKRRTAVLLTATAALVGCAASAQRASALEVAVNDDAVLLNTQYYSRDIALDQARNMGATWVRVNYTYGEWARNKKNPYQSLDGLVSAARARFMSVHLTLTGTSRQDTRGSKFISYNNPNVVRYAKWVKGVAKHFKGKVRRYSIWNEPQFEYFLAPNNRPPWRSTSPAPKKYCALYKAGRAAIKSVDSKNKVLWGELAPLRDPLGFLKQAACRGTRTDGFAYHPYAVNKAAVGLGSKGEKALRTAASRYLHTSNLYYTEFGYLWFDKSRLAKTVAGFKYAQKIPGIKNLTYYILVHPPFKTPFDSGIINLDTSPDPVYTALRNCLVFKQC